ncbi:glycosyltransferase family 4 protein [Paenibacillus azoreducens]|nr:glycosyltransferase family 4 protein [Paenibacillus azoreducens]
MMKVLFTFYNPSGGMETLNRVRSKALQKRGIECHLLYTVGGHGLKNIEGIATYIMNSETDIHGLIEREQYDAIIVCTDINMLVKIGNLGYRGTLIYELQGLGTPSETEIILEDYRTRIIEHADALLYPHNPLLKKMLGSYFSSIPQFCFDDPLDCDHFGYREGTRLPYPVIGWIGRIQANKNWIEFLRIGTRLIQINPQIHLWFFDDDTLAHPDELNSFRHIVSSSPLLSQRLIRYSNVPHHQMAEYLSMIGDSGGMLVSTSIQEGFGYAVAESMLCRCPVLSTDSGGVRRLIYPNLTGKYYSRGNIEDAVKEAVILMIDSHTRNWLVKNAEAHIKKHFSADLYSERFLEMMHRV